MTPRPPRKKQLKVRAPGAPGVQLGEVSARGAILAGAASVFSELGVRAASVEDILKASGISRRTFYRLYGSKESVMVALYWMGTERLLETCRVVIAEEQHPFRQIARCVDAHLRNAKDFGRLVFVLGGEAQRAESTLHARRAEVHQRLAGFLAAGAAGATDHVIDPLVWSALILALEGVTRIMLEEGDEGRKVSEASVERLRAVMTRMACSTLAGEGVT